MTRGPGLRLRGICFVACALVATVIGGAAHAVPDSIKIPQEPPPIECDPAMPR